MRRTDSRSWCWASTWVGSTPSRGARMAGGWRHVGMRVWSGYGTSPFRGNNMAALRKPSAAPIYQLKVTLKGSKPPIWRRILVPADVNLAKLHQILQVAMGWGGGHLHQFIVGGVYYGEPHPDFGDEIESERKVR